MGHFAQRILSIGSSAGLFYSLAFADSLPLVGICLILACPALVALAAGMFGFFTKSARRSGGVGFSPSGGVDSGHGWRRLCLMRYWPLLSQTRRAGQGRLKKRCSFIRDIGA